MRFWSLRLLDSGLRFTSELRTQNSVLRTSSTAMRTSLLLSLLITLAAVALAQGRPARIGSIVPTFGEPGTTVTIRGAGFMGYESGSWVKETASEAPPGSVEFNGVPGDVLYWRDDLITVKVPIGASTGPVSVVVRGAKPVASGDSFEVPYTNPGGGSRRAPAAASGRSRAGGTAAVGDGDASPEGFLRRGHDFFRRKDYRSAIIQYESAASLAPNTIPPLEFLALAYSRLGIYTDAIATLNK